MSFVQNYGVHDPPVMDCDDELFLEESFEEMIENHLFEEEERLKEIRETDKQLREQGVI